MKFYLESISADEFMDINQAVGLAGVYTKPSDFTKSQADVGQVLKSLLEYMGADQKIFVYGMTGNFRTLLEEGRILQKVSSQIVLTLPASDQGFMAAKASKRMHIPVAMGAFFQSEQAAIALQDPDLVLFYDLEQAGKFGDSMAVLKDMLALLEEGQKESLVVICPNLESVRKVIAAGARAIWTGNDVYIQMLFNPMTEMEMAKDRDEWLNTYTRTLVMD